MDLLGFFSSDLAARNCLVFPDLSVKIGDYGISRCVYKVCELIFTHVKALLILLFLPSRVYPSVACMAMFFVCVVQPFFV